MSEEITPEQEARWERENRYARLTVWLVSAVILALGLGAAYWIWPSGAIDLPLSAMTLGALLRVVGSIVVALGAMVAAFLVGYDA